MSGAVVPLEPIKVLVVEHDASDAELNVHALRGAGIACEVEVVGTLAAFARAIGAHQVDVVLADYRMPGWTGMEALHRLREAGNDTPFILVTGTLGEELVVECLRQGATDFVLKKNLDRLPMVVRRAVAEHRARRDLLQADVTARTVAAEVRERDELFRQLADNTTELFFVVQAQFRETLYVNKAYERIWGRSVKSLYANPSSFLEPVHDEDRPRLIESIKIVQQGTDPGEVEFRVRLGDGEVHWVLAHALPVTNADGIVYRIVGVAREITERRKARTAVEVSEGRYRALVDATFDAIVVASGGTILEVNRGFVDMFGYDSEAEVIGHLVHEFLAPETHAAVNARIAGRIEGRHDVIGVRKDGTRLQLEAISRERDDGGVPVRITALHDVTEQRALEAMLRQAHKMEAVGRLAGSVAHDFNNLLTVIGGFTDFALAETATDDPRREYLDEIGRAAGAAAELTRRLLAFSHKDVVLPRTVMLSEALVSSGRMLERLIGEDVVLTIAVDAPLAVRIDPTQLDQVIMNLAVNARDAMPTGGRLTIRTELAGSENLVIRAQAGAGAGSFAAIVVADTGTGMDETTRLRVFEPFFTTKEAGKGTGLGLAMAYAIVNKAGGFIDLASVPGQGTTFTIFLPLVADEPADGSDAGSEEIPRGTETVLLVEDAPSVRMTVRGMLERLGYTVLEAPDGRTALRIAALRRPIALILTDVVMPTMSGREVASKALAIRPDLRVLYMSGYVDDALLRHGVEAATINFIPKPFTIGVLARKVRAVLSEPALG